MLYLTKWICGRCSIICNKKAWNNFEYYPQLQKTISWFYDLPLFVPSFDASASGSYICHQAKSFCVEHNIIMYYKQCRSICTHLLSSLVSIIKRSFSFINFNNAFCLCSCKCVHATYHTKMDSRFLYIWSLPAFQKGWWFRVILPYPIIMRK